MESINRRRVIGNTIISDSLPKLKITVDSDFEFVGILRFVLKDIAFVERVIFVDRQDSKVTRLFIVQFEGMLDGVDFKYTYQTTNPIYLDKHAYQHDIYVYSNAESVRQQPGAESDRTTQFLRDHGYIHEDGLAMSRFARIVDAAYRHEIIIFYQETLGSLHLSLESYSQLSTENQQVLANELRERSLLNFRLTDLDE